MAKWTALTVGRINDVGYHRDQGADAARGLYLQVTAAQNGGVVRSWIYRFVSPVSGKARWMGLGPADAIGLAKARELARAARSTVKLGGDPIDDRRKARQAKRLEAARRISFGKCASDYISSHRSAWKNEKHIWQWETTFEGKSATTSAINDLPVNEIDTALVLKVLKPIWTAKPETATRVRGRIERVLAWATVSGYRTGENPARWSGHLAEMLPRKAAIHRVQHHKALPYGDLPEFMARLRALDSVSARALEFTILTAARTNETIGAKDCEFDIPGKLWTVPADRMKAKRPHRVPLPDRCIEILDALPRAGDYVFAGARPKHPLSNMAQLEVVRGLLGNGYTVHGFRSTFRTWCAERTNFPREIAELALAHTIKSKVEAAYQRADVLDKRRQLMDAWERYCASGSGSKRSPAVVPLRAASL